MRIKRYFIALCAAAAVASAAAGPIDEARKLYHQGQYEAVVKLMRPVVKRSPRDGNATYFLGASLYNLGEVDEAVQPLTVAEGRGVADASAKLARIAFDRYDVDGAQKHMSKWSAALKKAKKDEPEEYSQLASKLVMMCNMLDRVEKIEVIDSMAVDENAFFNFYKLSKQAGNILPPDAVTRLGAGSGSRELSAGFMPQSRTEVLWAAADSSGIFSLYGADILDDGTLDHSSALKGNLGDGGNALFPFLMTDGTTLYFSSDGDGSLGGYDIFMTRRNDASDDDKDFYAPQNMGMPYNSPYNDYLMAIDETSGLGWWATDRNAEPGKVTIYVFIPSQVRVNADPDEDDVQALARVSDISLTQKPGADYSKLIAFCHTERKGASGNSGMDASSFTIDMGNGRVYDKLADFRNDDARAVMLDALAARAALRRHLEQEDALREQYRNGNHGVAQQILDSEAETGRMRQRVMTLRNTAVRLETGR